MSSLGVVLLVTGGRGQLGRDLVDAATRSGMPHLDAPGSAELDVTDRAAVDRAVVALADRADRIGLPAVVINAAAYTAVDAAESDRDGAYAVNATAPELLADACATRGVHLIHVSTDYVFDGDAGTPYRAGDPTGPRSVYGHSKLAGEQAVLGSRATAHVVRTAWLYGAAGSNFVRTMIRLEQTTETLSVVDDQRGSPTWTRDLAEGLLALAQVPDRVPPGVLHCVNAGATTWFGFARAIFAELGADPQRVRPCRTEEFPRPAPRPANSVLDMTAWAAAGLPTPRPWRDALSAAFAAGTFSSG